MSNRARALVTLGIDPVDATIIVARLDAGESLHSALQEAAPKAVETFYDLSPMFHPAVREDMQESLKLFHKYRKYFSIHSKIDMALFMGQVRQEVGYKFVTVENLNYSCRALKMFSALRRKPFLRRKIGRCNGHKANQRAIANIIYDRKTLGNIHVGDGWKFRGRGAGHLTGRYNYQQVDKWLRRHIPQLRDELDLMRTPDNLARKKYAIISFAVFWEMKDVQRKVRKFNHATSNAVSRVVNKHTPSKSKRWEHSQQAMNILEAQQ